MAVTTLFGLNLLSALLLLLLSVSARPTAQQIILKASFSAVEKYRTSTHIDPAPDTVGLLLNEDEDDAIHIWLPLGKRLHTSSNALLPLHPFTARVTTTIASTPERATDEFLNTIRCSVFPRLGHPGRESFGGVEYAVAMFSKTDGVVKFANTLGEEWLFGTEVEAYECS